MKNKLIVLGLLGMFTFSCNTTAEKTESNHEEEITKPKVCVYKYDANSTIVGWEAYKTTAKKGVKGVFNQVNVLIAKESNDMLQTLSGATFSIPVSSINSENEVRDKKLQNSFFGNMNVTEVVSGVVKSINEKSAIVEISMNGVTKDYTGDVNVEDKTVKFAVNINLDDFEAQIAMDSLNVVCGELHKGEDGVSKLWSEVSINIETTLIEKCD